MTLPASASSESPERLKPHALWLLGALAMFSVGVYLLASVLFGTGVGFPLDDAWIHQTYARNLGLQGEWAYLPGHPSGGSTSPLWTVLLSVGHLLRLGPFAVTFVLGAVLLWALAVVGERVLRASLPSYRSRFPWVGLCLILEWHLVWAAGSGMETLLHALLVLSVLGWLIVRPGRWTGLGILIGLSAWVRPDGVTLFGPALMVLVLQAVPLRRRFADLGRLALGFAALFVPYLFFNLWAAGSPWPNTFYAKQIEYAILQTIPVWRRLLTEASLPMIGAGFVLLPGVIAALVWASRERRIGWLAAAIWYLGYIGMYAWRLPVTYQHGRYIMPAMPVLFLLGMLGFLWLTSAWRAGWGWRLRVAWSMALMMTGMGFWVLGIQTYVRDVGIINTEMVAAARWVADNLPDDELIAAHDIGALGYFAERDLLDLAGLISPEVIPFLRDEDRLAGYLDQREATILVTFPSWYPGLTARAVPVYQTGGLLAPAAGGENMVVYCWPLPGRDCPANLPVLYSP